MVLHQRVQKKTSKIDVHYEVIVDLLSDNSKQTFYYMRVLWQYLTDNHGLQCSQSTFRAYINRKPEFKKYFEEGNELFQAIREKFDMKLLLVNKHN